MKKLLSLSGIAGLFLILTGCNFEQSHLNSTVNYAVYAIGIAAVGILAFFIIFSVVSTIYKGKKTAIKVLKKKELKFEQRKGVGAKTAQINARYSRSKIVVEIGEKKKTLRCNDNVILDKLSVGKTHNVRVKFGVIVKILKD
ncbi:MAG: hypothetical protein FWD34_10040 [Oscillospiraceae bacterium]|nr:hypothetical protein [Oscillospiraceae bacterium]